MPYRAGRTHRVLVALAISISSISAALALLAADEAKPVITPKSSAAAVKRPPVQVATVTNKYMGVADCARCHLHPTPADEELGVTDFVLLTEYDTWSKRDKHSQAFEKMIASERTKHMERVLKIDATKEPSCLACHAIRVGADEAETHFRVKDGVSCEACHGPASNWIDPHWKPSWRDKTTAEKAALGMKDVRDSNVRAQLCLSCHMGDIDAGKLVTHEMYAAGHPPLPGFELETFAAAMPPHWRRPWEKTPTVQKQLGYQSETMPQSRLVLTDSLIALRQSALLLGQQAQNKMGNWPELALYDCQACHHELRSASWRQQRRLGGQPGRPSLHAWPLALAEISVARSSRQPSSVLELLRPLTTSLDQQAFGKQKAVAKAAVKVTSAIDDSLAQLAKQPLTTADARAILVSICSQAVDAPLDYDSARQLAWAFRIIYAELRGSADMSERLANDEQITAALDQLTSQLSLDLTAGRLATDKPLLGEPLVVANRYDPAAFQEQMLKLKTLIDTSDK